ncbi:MAG: FliM/FliN family flagellar motor switch protein, partial [Hungatella sp.]
ATYITLNFNFGQLELSPGMFQAIGMDETIVIITVNLKMDKIQGVLSICFPGNLLSDIFSILDKRINREKEDGMNYVDSSKDIMHYIQGSELSVRARLGNIRLNLVDIYNLHEGDIINLNKPKDSEVEIQVEGTSWFKGRLGQHKKNMSVLITDVNARVKAKQESMET